MIHINVGRLPMNELQPFIQAANTAQAAVDAETNPDQRRVLIDTHRPKWVAFRPFFETLSHHKCWYTESRNPGTDDDVDHYRPKGRVAEDEQHVGYYWKALDWRNFRLSCHRANRPRTNPNTEQTHGKSDHFPLLDPTQRARAPADDLLREQPLLLDPCDPLDPPKLTYKPDGTVAVSPRYEQDAFAVAQVDASRIYLHLEWPQFVDDRTQLYNRIAFKVEEGKQHAERTEQGDNGSRVALKSVITDLADMTREESPYSAAATAFISTFRELWWIRDAVLKLPITAGAA